MRLRNILFAGLALALASAGSASAATLVIGTIGSAPAAGEYIFANFDTISPTATGTNFGIRTGTTSTYVAPNNTAFFVVFGGGSATFNFGGTGTRSFSLDAGSIDTYNALTLNFVGGGTQVFGSGGTPLPVGTSARLFFTASPGQSIAGVTLASSVNAFEVDNLAISPVPEPASWAMLIGGLGLAGGTMRRRSGKRAIAAA